MASSETTWSLALSVETLSGRGAVFKHFQIECDHCSPPVMGYGRSLELDGDRFHFGVLLQSVFAQFTSYTRLLEAAKRSSGVENVVAVHPNRTGANTVRDRVGFLDIARPHSRGQTIVGAVRTLYHLVYALKGDNAHYRTEDLFLGDLHVVLNIGEDGRLDEVTAVSDSIATADELGTLRAARLDVAHDFVELRLIDLRTLFRVGIERVADGSIPRSDAALFDELVVDLLLDEHPRSGAAALAVIEEEPEMSALNGVVQVRVREYDVRALSAEFQRDSLQIGLRGSFHDQMP